jgi:D-alanine-D-alanine ligase
VEGRDFNVSIIGNKGEPEVLTPAEMLFLKSGIENNILCYDSKWNEESGKYKNSVRSFEFKEGDHELYEQLKKYSKECWKVFGLSGYARVDFRIDRNNRPFVIEINANPCLSPDGGFFAAAQNEGMSYKEMINRILAEAQL